MVAGGSQQRDSDPARKTSGWLFDNYFISLFMIDHAVILLLTDIACNCNSCNSSCNFDLVCVEIFQRGILLGGFEAVGENECNSDDGN